MYTAVPFGVVANGVVTSRPLAIRVRQDEIVRPLRVIYVWEKSAAAGSSTFAISRNLQHRNVPPSNAQMLEGGPVFFGLARQSAVFASLVGFNIDLNHIVVPLTGIEVAGELTVCVHNATGVSVRYRAEFYYELAPVSEVDKAMAIWRTETKEQPN